jgi:hypothetical protein
VRAVIVGGIGSLAVTGLWSVFFPSLRRADTLTAESLLSADGERVADEPVEQPTV